MHAGLVGAGLVGRLLAWSLVQCNWQVSLFEQDGPHDRSAAAYVAGGMLTPIAESEIHDPLISQLGFESLKLWREILPKLSKKVFFQQRGTLLTAHPRDTDELHLIAHRLRQRVGPDQVYPLTPAQINSLEPEIHFKQAYYLPNEAQIDARQLLDAFLFELNNPPKKSQVTWHSHSKINLIEPYCLHTHSGKHHFDWVFDCRGHGASSVLPDLRGVRGELIYLHAQEVCLTRMVRLFHPRYRLYIIPRPGNIYLIGATEIDGADTSPISVRSCLELLSAAYSVHSGFAEARILQTNTGVRPAFPDNLPRILSTPGLVRINGLYRHGFLIAPAIIKIALNLCQQTQAEQSIPYPNLIQSIDND